MIVLEGLEESFDNEQAEQMLCLSMDKITHARTVVRKSMYDFDLETPEGIEKLMALLPIMDPEILKDIMTEIWPEYPTDIDARKHRLEIKGFLRDYMESYGQDADRSGEVTEGEPGTGVDPSMGISPDGADPNPETAPESGANEQTPVAN